MNGQKPARLHSGGTAWLRGLVLGVAMCALPAVQAQAEGASAPSEPDLVYVGSGRFVMGDSAGAGQPDERPPHAVQLPDFFISALEVTRADYARYAVAVRTPFDVGSEPLLPMTGVTWDDAVAYARWLSRQTRQTYRLPSEAEWEYAARAKGQHAGLYYDGNDPQTLCRWANIADVSARATVGLPEHTPCDDGHSGLAFAGAYAPNAIGVRDMLGNVWEWTLDCYTEDYADASPTGRPARGRCEQRVIRGGSFRLPAGSARLSNRESFGAADANDQIGFRLVREP